MDFLAQARSDSEAIQEIYLRKFQSLDNVGDSVKIFDKSQNVEISNIPVSQAGLANTQNH